MLKKLLKLEIIDEDIYNLSIKEPLPNGEFRFKILAPHLAQKIKSEYHKKNIVNTTIDYKIQSYVERATKNYIAYQRNMGIMNGAVLVTETKTGKVKAYVGSQDFFDFKGFFM